MNEKHYTSEGICDPVTSAENSLSQPNGHNDSALIPARLRRPHGGAGKPENKPIHVHAAESSLKSSQGTNVNIAPENAPTPAVKQIARAAQSAENLCDSCAIVIAQSLVAMQRGNDPASHLGKASMPERKRRILLQSLVLFAAARESIDTTPTTADLSTLFGFVRLAIGNSPKPSAAADPVLYYPKSSTAERDAGLESMPTIRVDDGRQKAIDNAYQRGETGRKNPHPTVKPVSLTKHLASLLLPPACYADRRLLIPFAGVGSEVLGALLAGWETIVGIELVAKHVSYGNLRISRWQEIAAQLHTAEPDRIVEALTKPKPAPLTSARAKEIWTQPIAVAESDYTGTLFEMEAA